jgi:hypothetical protein
MHGEGARVLQALAIAALGLILDTQTVRAAAFSDCRRLYSGTAVEEKSYGVQRVTVSASEDYTYWGEAEGHDERAELAIGRGRGVSSVCNLGDRGTCTGTDTGCGYFGLGHIVCEGQPGEGVTCGPGEHCPGRWSGASAGEWTRMDEVASAKVVSFHPYNCDCIRQTPGPKVGRYAAAAQGGRSLACGESFGSIAQVVPLAGAIVSDGWEARHTIETGFLCGALDGTTLGVVVEGASQETRRSGEATSAAAELGLGSCDLTASDDMVAVEDARGILGVKRVIGLAKSPRKQVRRIPRF